MPKTKQPSYTELAKIAYEAYGKSSKGKNYQGKPMPEFDDLPEAIKQHWIAAMIAVVDACGDV